MRGLPTTHLSSGFQPSSSVRGPLNSLRGRNNRPLGKKARRTKRITPSGRGKKARRTKRITPSGRGKRARRTKRITPRNNLGAREERKESPLGITSGRGKRARPFFVGYEKSEEKRLALPGQPKKGSPISSGIIGRLFFIF